MHLNAAFRVNLVTYDQMAAMPCSTFIFFSSFFFTFEKKKKKRQCLLNVKNIYIIAKGMAIATLL